MEKFGIVLVMFILSLCGVTQAAPQTLTYQGRIVKSDGTPLEHSNVSFLFQITDPSGSCLIYQEQVIGYNMVNSQGVFDVPIGLGSVQFLGNGSKLMDAFNDSTTFSCGTCSLVSGSYHCVNGTGSYTPSSSDGRKLRVSFYDGSGWSTITPDSAIRAVPFAGYAASAQKLGNNVAADFLLKAGLPTCGANTFLSWNGTSLSCSGVAGASGGTVTNVTSANSYVSIANGTTAPVLTLNVGTAANTIAAGDDSRITNALQSGATASGDLSGTYPSPKVVKLQGVSVAATAPTNGDFLKFNGTSWLPVTISTSDVGGLNLSSYMTQTAFSSAVSSATCTSSQSMYWNSVSSSFQCQSISLSGMGSVTNVSSANSYLSVTNGTSTPQLTLNVGTAANTVAAGNDSRITGALQPATSVSGDLSGTFASPTVVALRGVSVSATAPTSGQVLQYNGTNWIPTTANGGTVTAVSSANSYLSVSNGTSTPQLTLNVGTGANTVAAGNDSRITGALQSGTTAGGDLSGTYPSPSVSTVGSSAAADIHSAEVAANAATSANTASTIIKRDASGGFIAGAAKLSSVVLRDSATATVTLQAPTTVSSSYILRLPANQGGANEFLLNDGSGNLSWSALPATGVSSVSVSAPITNSGTSTAPTLGITQASTSTSGYLSAADWNTFNGKLNASLSSARLWVGNASSVPVAVAASGDLTLANNGAFEVVKLRGTNVSSTTPLTGQFFRYSGTAWTPTGLVISDIKSTVTPFGAAFANAACAASESLYYASATDNFLCQTITAAAGSLTGTVPVANLPTATATGVYVNGGNSFGAAGKMGTKDSNNLTFVTNNTDRVTINTSGNVGIGTTSPVGRLSIESTSNVVGFQMRNSSAGGIDTFNIINDAYINGNFWFAKGTSASGTPAEADKLLNFDNEGTVEIFGQSITNSNDKSGILSLKTQSSSTGGQRNEVSLEYYADRTNLNARSGYIGFESGSAFDLTVANEKAGSIILSTSGNVGIGTSSPSYKLHVVGSAGLSSGTAWTNASDIRLKDIHGDYSYGLNEILKLHTVRYSYKKDNPLGLPSDFQKTGFIAQEVQKVIPDAVSERSDGYLELNVDPIHWAVVNAVKDLYQKFVIPLRMESDSHAEKIKRLEKENQELKQRLKLIEQRLGTK